MSAAVTVALDAMGGDAAPEMVVAGADMARERHPGVRFLLCGDETQIAPLLGQRPALAAVCEIRHTATAVSSHDKPSQAFRRGRGTSMWLAIETVQKGEAAAVVSAGSTGALMAMAMHLLRTIPGVDRPAIASFIPTATGESVMLDLGANIDCSERNLAEFAVMGAAFARTCLGLERPRVALLNIGSEEIKGNEAIKGAAARLRQMSLAFEFTGYVEGNGLGAGAADVIVADGFAGNVALKTAEGTARQISGYMAGAFRRSLLSRLGYLLARSALRALRDRLDPQRYNGGVFLGIGGLVVKSHGGADARGFAAAIDLAVDMAAGDLCDRIASDMRELIPGPDLQAAAP